LVKTMEAAVEKGKKLAEEAKESEQRKANREANSDREWRTRNSR